MMQRKILEYDSLLGYKFIPNIKARIPHENGGYLIKVNNSGFRCENDFIKEKKGKKRVLLFGDSFTAGDGVSNHYRYGDLLEKKISNLEVYNFGLPGSGTDQQYLAYRKYAVDIEHDLLVISILVENIDRVYSRYRSWLDDRGHSICYAKPYFELINNEIILKGVPPKKEPIDISNLSPEEQKWIAGNIFNKSKHYSQILKIIDKFELRETFQKIIHYQPNKQYNSPDNPAWILMKALLKEWINNQPRKVLVVLIPTYQYIEEISDPHYYQQRFEELTHETNCSIYDTLPNFLKYPLKKRREFRFKKDPHFTPFGHEVLAESIYPIVNKLLANR